MNKLPSLLYTKSKYYLLALTDNSEYIIANILFLVTITLFKYCHTTVSENFQKKSVH